MFTFAFSYTRDEFMQDYVYQHLIMYPIVIIAISLIFVIFVRVKSDSIIRSTFIKAKKYYNRYHYRGLCIIAISSVTFICILLLLGILFNVILSKQLSQTVDTLFGAVQKASDNVLAVRDGMQNLKTSLTELHGSGSNGTAVIVNGTQATILSDINLIEAQFGSLNTTLGNFSSSLVGPSANVSLAARAILLSLATYGQLTNVPLVSEIPEINEGDVDNKVDSSQSSIAAAIAQLEEIKSKVSNINVDLSNYDFSSITDGLDSASSVIDDFDHQILSFYNKKNQTQHDVQHYDHIRLGIIILTYLVPLIAGVVGLLAIQLRTPSVARAWYHVLLTTASLCGIFAGLYFTLSIVIEDVCEDVDTAIFVGIRTAEPNYASLKWYQDLNEYYPIVTKCSSNDSLLQYFDIPPEVEDFMSNSPSIVGDVTGNYTALIANATKQLDASITSIESTNYTLVTDSAKTKNELVGVQQQLTDLSKFGIDMAAYNASLDAINSQTSYINATYPDGQTIIYSIFYVAANISLLQIGDSPYKYTTKSYQENLNTSLNTFLALNDAYNAAVDLTNQINSNVTKVLKMIDTLDQAQADYDSMLAQVNTTGDNIHKALNNIDSAAYNLTYNIIPSLLNVTQLWGLVLNASKCDYMAHAYNKSKYFICTDVKDATAVYVTTNLVAVATLLFTTFAASFAYIAFNFPYKPYYYSTKDNQYDYTDENNDDKEFQLTSSQKMPSFISRSNSTKIESNKFYVAL